MTVRSLRNRLALLFFAVTLGAIAGIYLYVAPQLESALRDEKLRDLAARRAWRYSVPLERAVDQRRPAPAWIAAREPGRRPRERARDPARGHPGHAGRADLPDRSDSTARAEADDLDFAVAGAPRAPGAWPRPAESTPRPGRRPGRACRSASTAGVGPTSACFSAPLADVQAQRRPHPPPDPDRRRVRAGVRGAGRLPRRARAGAARQAAGARRPARSRRRLRRPLPVDRDDELGQLARALQRHAAPARASSTPRASASSRPPRTSCARRSSRWAASSSCCRTRTSTRRRGSSSWDSCASRSSACASWPPSCSTSRSSRPARSSCDRERDRPRRARAHGHRRVHPRARPARLAPRAAPAPTGGSRPSATAERVAQIMRILIDNALTHTPHGHRDRRQRRAQQRPRPARRPRLRPGHPPDDAAAHLRAVLHLRRRPGLRPRARDRARAGRADARPLCGRVVARPHARSRWSCRREHARVAGRRRRRVAAWPRCGGRRLQDDGRHRGAGARRRARSARRRSRWSGARRRRLRPGRDLRPRGARGGHRDQRFGPGSPRCGLDQERRSRPRLGLRAQRQRRDRHQRARGHQWPGCAPAPGARRSTCSSPTATRWRRGSSAPTPTPTSRC